MISYDVARLPFDIFYFLVHYVLTVLKVSSCTTSCKEHLFAAYLINSDVFLGKQYVFI